ncbi:cell surface protein [Yersinia pestis subsp. microtus bv. Altaica]|nr:coiled stalk of trimeric autotransporter adhesin family protein [Yersinia pestis str. Pestoides B]AYW82669.1 cell surface protein [Yersinia pestis]EEO90572.1 putative surface protein [Yersinia pestis Pestoides A]OUY14119.1 cell surface protein [Yersinia pestis subsp. microtus bv. Altaica]OVY65766.1 cell surface protein [Yersinia pestis subsp. microtus bv. Altaica]
MKSIQKCDCNYLVRFAVSDSFIRDNSFRSLLAIFMVTIFVPNTAFSQLYVNNANDPGCYVIADGGFTGVTNSDQNCYTLSLNNINTNGGQLFVGGKGGIAGKPSFIATPWTGTFTTAVGTSNVATAYGFIATPWTGTFTTAVGTSNVATAYGFVVQSNGAFINGDTYVKGGLFLNGRKATNLAPATISSTSTDAVVGSQLYTVIQDGTRYFHANSVNPQDSVPAGQDAIAVGPATVVNGNNGIGIGSSAVVGPSAVGGIAIGPNTQATGIASTALGAGSQAHGSQSLALGAGATASQANSIALGASSVTTVGAESDYSAYGLTAPQTSVGEVGMGTAQGNRKITGVAAGSADYDVVNVAQLTAVGDKVEQNTADITSLGGRVTNVEGGMTRITNGGGIKYFHTHSTEPDSVASGSDSVAIGPNAQASGTTSIAMGAGSTAQGAQSLALGAGAAASQANSIALGASSVTTVGAESDYSAYGLTAPQTSVGEVGVGTAQGNRKITGVAAGSADYDAVNVAQLTAVGDKVDQNTADITSLDGRVTNVEGEMASITNGGGVKYFHTHSTESDSVASGSDSVAIGPNAQASGTASVASGKGTLASGNGAVAIGDAASVSAEGSVALGQGSADNGRGAESYTGKYSTTDNTTSGTVSVGNAATGETRTVSNVADGREAMDAVNLRQLDGAMAAVGDTVSGLQNGTDGMFQVNNNSGQAKPSVTGTDAMAGGGRLRGVWQPQYRDGYGQQGDGGKQHRAGGQLSGGS